MSRTLILSLFLAHGAIGAQPSAPAPKAAPLRELPWAQLNFLHTTDVHGWWGGHVQEASFSADWGDYISFAKHLRDRADADGSDLLLIDTGDRIEGNAIYDSSKPRGKFTYEIAKEQSIDLICSGNHELYKAESANGEFFHTVPDFKGNYLASNLDIINPNNGQRQPLAPRYKKFKTKNQGIRILAFGFIFDFTGNDNNTFVIPVEQTVKEAWFRDALKDKDVDLVLVYGHVDVRSAEYALLYKTIRSAHWDTPIQFFGGHSHIRDYKIFDSTSVALESGRYMETIGFMSINGLRTAGSDTTPAQQQKEKLTFSRRYIDNNLYSMHHHTNKDNATFPTKPGLNVTSAIEDARESLGLGERYGCVPHDLWVSRRPYPHEESIFTWLDTEVLPQSIKPSGKDKKALVITNTGSIRLQRTLNFSFPLSRANSAISKTYHTNLQAN
jgi:2',3'-cyclic-nucleotide 2'-phosphodiesterase (5'-nucleotidase family)